MSYIFGNHTDTGGDVTVICDLPARTCVSLAYDAKFNLVVEAAGDEGLRFRKFAPETAGRSQAIEDQSYKPPMNQSNWIMSDVMRHLNVPTSHVVFTPYNMMLCCHGNRMRMVRHCTGCLVYETTLDCEEISGAVFDSSTDSFYVSHSSTGTITCMHYMQFHSLRKVELNFSVVPSSLCIFANTLLIANQSSLESYCGLCYSLDKQAVYKINRVVMSKILSGRQQKLTDVAIKQPRPSTLNGVVTLAQTGSQNSKATMIGISSEDRCMYMYKVRSRSATEGSRQNLVFRFKSRDDATFTIQDGNLKIPRCIVAIPNEFVAVYYDAGGAQADSSLSSSGILLFRIRQSEF